MLNLDANSSLFKLLHGTTITFAGSCLSPTNTAVISSSNALAFATTSDLRTMHSTNALDQSPAPMRSADSPTQVTPLPPPPHETGGHPLASRKTQPVTQHHFRSVTSTRSRRNRCPLVAQILEEGRRRVPRTDSIHPPAENVSVNDTTKRPRVTRKKRLRVARGPPEAGERIRRGRRPLVVTDDMELRDISSLVTEVLERVGENERELRRLRKEVAVAKPRSSVRERKFVIDTRAKMLGAAFAGSVLGMIVGWSVLPNLWLLGAVAGATAFAALSRTRGTIGGFCSTTGIQVALVYKDVRDWWEQTVFLYKTGKLSYTYWRVFEKYDQSWGLTEKYNGTVRRLSKEAVELDRQYKIRTKASRARRSVTKFSQRVGSSTLKEVSQFAGTASEWSTNQLQQWGVIGEDRAESIKKKGLRLSRFVPYKRRGQNVDGRKRPLGISIDLEAIFGGNSQSLYSAPAAGKARKPGYRGDPVIPARIRHLVMTPKQIRDERLRKYRVGFLGMRRPRSFDRDD